MGKWADAISILIASKSFQFGEAIFLFLQDLGTHPESFKQAQFFFSLHPTSSLSFFFLFLN